jgi:hypothetical protein
MRCLDGYAVIDPVDAHHLRAAAPPGQRWVERPCHLCGEPLPLSVDDLREVARETGWPHSPLRLLCTVCEGHVTDGTPD